MIRIKRLFIICAAVLTLTGMGAVPSLAGNQAEGRTIPQVACDRADVYSPAFGENPEPECELYPPEPHEDDQS